jgi:hypothetical protein
VPTVPLDPPGACSIASRAARRATVPRSRDTTQLYLTHFALKGAPFSKQISDAEFWLPTSKQAIVETFIEALDERASSVSLENPASGKTCVLRARCATASAPPAGFRPT